MREWSERTVSRADAVHGAVVAHVRRAQLLDERRRERARCARLEAVLVRRAAAELEHEDLPRRLVVDRRARAPDPRNRRHLARLARAQVEREDPPARREDHKREVDGVPRRYNRGTKCRGESADDIGHLHDVIALEQRADHRDRKPAQMSRRGLGNATPRLARPREPRLEPHLTHERDHRRVAEHRLHLFELEERARAHHDAERAAE